MNRFFKNQKGIAASDGLIAVLIITLFSGLIATISYNIYLSNASIKRMSKATNYIVDVFEYVDKSNYDDITLDNLTGYFNDKYYYEQDGATVKEDAEVKIKENNENLEDMQTPFKGEITITKYNETEGNTDKLDLVKEITMKVKYKLGNKDQEIEMKRVKARENLITPNFPDMSTVPADEGYSVYPIKRVNETWKICDLNDPSWYNYEAGNWALVAMVPNAETLKFNIGDEIDITNEDIDIYAWIPRYAYNNNNNTIEFLFSNTDNYIQQQDEYNTLSEIDTEYSISTEFNGLTGVWTSGNEDDETYETLNSIYPLNK